MGTELNEKDERQREYKTALYEFNKLVVYRQLTPWYYIHTMWMLTPSFWFERKLIKTMHDYTNNVIRKRKQNGSDKSNVTHDDQSVSKKKMAMLDLLLLEKTNGYPIDDDGIREEVDTFTFEVILYTMYLLFKFQHKLLFIFRGTTLLQCRFRLLCYFWLIIVIYR